MPAPPIQVFLTTIITQPTLKRRQEYILRILQTHKIPFTSYDLASDDAAKTLWRRKAPAGKQELPEAVEFGELDIFLRRNEDWNEKFADPAIQLPEVPIGVPGAYMPSEMTPKKTPVPTPLPSQSGDGSDSRKDIDLGDQLSVHDLKGIKASEEELADLVKELGLGGEDANDLIKGLTQTQAPTENTKSEVKTSPSLVPENPSDTLTSPVL
ncbi:hypothetical protein Clacol_003764 [Clathrus columnatus]|uniref:Uncharacterized protein n=1 Tax=Clathrus columnatus TaxID=1419009 RepID=A0AAV5A4G1_9AGAM|nr:hypothetical protein Clacol_003764 [Clathrus columnatus]